MADSIDAFPDNRALSFRVVAGEVNVSAATTVNIECYLVIDPQGICTVPIGGEYAELVWETTLNSPSIQVNSVVWPGIGGCTNSDFTTPATRSGSRVYWYGPVVFFQGGQPMGLVDYWDCHQRFTFQLTGTFSGASDYVLLRVIVVG